MGIKKVVGAKIVNSKRCDYEKRTAQARSNGGLFTVLFDVLILPSCLICVH